MSNWNICQVLHGKKENNFNATRATSAFVPGFCFPISMLCLWWETVEKYLPGRGKGSVSHYIAHRTTGTHKYTHIDTDTGLLCELGKGSSDISLTRVNLWWGCLTTKWQVDILFRVFRRECWYGLSMGDFACCKFRSFALPWAQIILRNRRACPFGKAGGWGRRGQGTSAEPGQPASPALACHAVSLCEHATGCGTKLRMLRALACSRHTLPFVGMIPVQDPTL